MLIKEYSIVIPTHNRREKLKNLIESIYSIDSIPAEIIVVDDASTDGSKEYISKRFPDIKYYEMEREKWPGFTISYGIAKAHNNLVYIIDDDNVIDERSVKALLSVFATDISGEYGVVGPVTCYFKERNKIMYAGARYNKITSTPNFNFAGSDYSVLETGQNKNKLIEVDGIPNAFMVRRDFAILSGLIPQYIPAQGEDGFLIYSIKRKLKKKIVVSTNAVIFHDYEETGRYNNVRLYYTMRTKIHFIRMSFSFPRNIINLSFTPLVLFYWALKAAKSDRADWGTWILVRGYMDGIFGIKERKFIQ